MGILQYSDNGTGHTIKVDIHGNIDKGFFQSEGEWTCYRRNYFSCICSFSLGPYYPNAQIQYIQGRDHPATVRGFAMSISAAVADNDGHAIDLVQHTPKRDKGPTAAPEKVRLLPKQPQSSHPLSLYGNDPAMGNPSRLGYGEGFPGMHSGDGYNSEHTFERIQFKQATANNGKRRAAQQYYHLLVELWADIGTHSSANYVRIAYRKSAKMIVRGRSPGHYQSERRGSTSSGPGGSAGSISGYSNNQMMGPEYSGSTVLGSNYGSNFDSRGGNVPYGTGRHHQELTGETLMTAEEPKLDASKPYQYYPNTIYETPQDGRDGVDMFTHPRPTQENIIPHHMSSYQERVKREPESAMRPSLFHPGPLLVNPRCGPFESKPSSAGYYPTMMSPSGVNMT
jgi:meiosis-specific transcription factor NDT80